MIMELTRSDIQEIINQSGFGTGSYYKYSLTLEIKDGEITDMRCGNTRYKFNHKNNEWEEEVI